MKLHSIVVFVEDIESAADSYSKLFGSEIEGSATFRKIRSGELEIGFHPADDKSPAGTTVPYFLATSIELAVEDAKAAGFELYRGPIESGGERISQVRNANGITIGFVQKL